MGKHLMRRRGNVNHAAVLVAAAAANWYEGDAAFAWSSVTDTNTTTVDPEIGGTLSIIAGSAVTAAGGLWTFGGSTVYASATGTTASYPATPVLYALAFERNASASFDYLFQHGDSYNFGFQTYGASVVAAVGFNGTSNPELTFASGISGTHILWALHDGTNLTIGHNQTTDNTVAWAPPSLIGRHLGFGGAYDGSAPTDSKLGSLQIVYRSGMTVTDAKAIVAKMQTHHGI